MARKHNVLDKHIFGCEVQSAHWNAETAHWDVQTSKGNFVAKIVVAAVGALCEPSLPDIAASRASRARSSTPRSGITTPT